MDKREKEVYEAAFKSERDVIRALERQYRDTLDTIVERIKILQADEMTQSRVYQLQYQQALKAQIDGILEKLHGDEYTTIQQYLHDCYTDGYIGTMYTLAGQGFPVIAPIDQVAAVRAVQLDSKISEGLYKSLGVDITKLKRSIRAEVTRGLSSGMSYSEMAVQLKEHANISAGRAKTIVRTEGHRVQQASADNARREAKAQGVEVVKQWDSTLDGNTRPAHRELDGQIRGIDEDFTCSAGTASMPGYFGDAGQDCNCRCVARTRAKRWLDEDDLAKMQERAEYFGNLADDPKAFKKQKEQDFDDFKGKYLKATKEEAASPRSDAQKTNPFVPAKSIAEAETFASQFVDFDTFGSVGMSYKGVGIDVANEINRTLDTLYSTFNVGKLGGIAAPAKNTKLGKMINAHGGYSPIRKSLLLNRDNTKSVSTFVDGLLEDKKAISDVLLHPEKYDLSKVSDRVRKVILASKKTGRSIVSETCESAMQHEFGHHLEGFVTREQWTQIKARMPEYADGISGYATESASEYFAESFASYMKGETVIDSYVRGIFDGWRK